MDIEFGVEFENIIFGMQDSHNITWGSLQILMTFIEDLNEGIKNETSMFLYDTPCHILTGMDLKDEL